MEPFPEPPRGFPGRLWVRISLRAGHLLTTGVLLGGLVFDQPTEALLPWLYGSLATGGLMLATDLHSSFAVVCESRGLMILAKIIGVVGFVLFWDTGIWWLLAVAIIGGIGSHASRAVRHRVLFCKNRLAPIDQRGPRS